MVDKHPLIVVVEHEGRALYVGVRAESGRVYSAEHIDYLRKQLRWHEKETAVIRACLDALEKQP